MRRNAAKRAQPKTAQLQLRISPAQKRSIQAEAKRQHMSMSEWILQRVLPSARAQFEELVAELSHSEHPSHVFAELLELLSQLGAAEFRSAVAELPAAPLGAYWQNYLAATIEHAAAQKQVTPPAWTAKIAPLEKPVFGSALRSLRHYLLVHSPPAFSRRNIFIDTSVGGRV